MPEKKDKPESKRKIKKFDVAKHIELDPTIDEHNIEGVIDEDAQTIEERAPLSIAARRNRGRTMRRYKTKIAAAKKRAARRKASPEKLKQRARKKARQIMRGRLAGGKNYADMSPSEKVQLDKRLNRVPASSLSRIATRQMPTVRKAETERLSRALKPKAKNESLDESFETFLAERCECPPKRFHQALTKEGKVKFDRRFKFFKKRSEIEEQSEILEMAAELMAAVEEAVKRSDDPSNREQGTDSLVRIYKKDTPGQCNKVNEQFAAIFGERQ